MIDPVPAAFTSDLAAAVASDMLERFSRYVAIDTQAAIGVEESPSTPGQLELARLLVDELTQLGLEEVELISTVTPTRHCPATSPTPRRSG